jgi:hypothetical protein
MTDLPGTGDEQDVAEALDDDKLRTDPYDRGDEPLDYPPDKPRGSLGQAITPTDELVGETAAERAWREEPDPIDRIGEAEGDPGGELDEALAADIEAEVADLVGEGADDGVADVAIGGIADPDADVDGVPSYDDAEGDEVGTAEELLGDESAEEAAMHLTADPPWHRSDGYEEG